MKVGLLPDPLIEGRLYLGTSSLIFLVTIDTVSFVVGKASTQHESVSTKTRRFLYPYF